MTNTNNDAKTPLTGGTRYRVRTRQLLQAAGYAFTQKDPRTDEYNRDGVVAHLVHASDDKLTRADISDGKGPVVEIKDGKLKIERTLARLILGDETQATAWYMTPGETKALPPLGKGDALIKTASDFVETSKEDVPVTAVSPEAKPVPKPAPRRKAPTVKVG